MKKSTKAALLSGLVFPGIGHMVLKRYLLGSILMLSALLALSVIVTVVTRRALAVLDGIYSGETPIDTVDISSLVSDSISSGDSSIVNIAVIVVVASWLIGIIDSYRVGITREKQDL